MDRLNGLDPILDRSIRNRHAVAFLAAVSERCSGFPVFLLLASLGMVALLRFGLTSRRHHDHLPYMARWPSLFDSAILIFGWVFPTGFLDDDRLLR